MPCSDVIECWLYESMEPFGEKGDYFRSGTQAALTANIARDPKVRREPFTYHDWIPDVEQAARAAEAEAERVNLMMQAFAASNPGTIRMKPKVFPRA